MEQQNNRKVPTGIIYGHQDFDGMISVFLMQQLHPDMHDVRWISPVELKSGRIKFTNKDIVVDLPEPSPHAAKNGVLEWWDHHASGRCTRGPLKFRGKCDHFAKSAARVILNAHPKLKQWEHLVEQADKIDTMDLTIEEYDNPNPAGIISLTLLSGNKILDDMYKLWLLEMLKAHPMLDIVNTFYVQRAFEYKKSVIKKVLDKLDYKIVENSNKKIIYVDVSNLEERVPVPKSALFKLFSQHPDAIASVKISSGMAEEDKVRINVGANIFNKDLNKINLGKLMGQYGGGGHIACGGCEIDAKDKEKVVKEVLKALFI